jgi:hypothetical protein
MDAIEHHALEFAMGTERAPQIVLFGVGICLSF